MRELASGSGKEALEKLGDESSAPIAAWADTVFAPVIWFAVCHWGIRSPDPLRPSTEERRGKGRSGATLSAGTKRVW
jgi:hypothetical protein